MRTNKLAAQIQAVSVGEQLYTYNAAIAEMRKTAAALQSGIETFDKDLARMKKQFDELKAEAKAEKEAGQLPDECFKGTIC